MGLDFLCFFFKGREGGGRSRDGGERENGFKYFNIFMIWLFFAIFWFVLGIVICCFYTQFLNLSHLVLGNGCVSVTCCDVPVS